MKLPILDPMEVATSTNRQPAEPDPGRSRLVPWICGGRKTVGSLASRFAFATLRIRGRDPVGTRTPTIARVGPQRTILFLSLLVAIATATLSDRLVDIGPPIRETRRRVILLTVDTLRADHVSSGAHALPTTPFLDGLLKNGHVFARAATPVPRTTPALASLLTGVYPHTSRVRTLSDPLAEEVVSVAELFRARGYRTIAVVSNHVLRPEKGLGRGFEIYDYAGDGRDAEATTRATLEHLYELDALEPVFLWVHYIDPHIPYAPPSDLARAFDPGYSGRYALRFGAAPGATGPKAFPSDLSKREAIYHNPLSESVTEHVRQLYAADVRYTDDAIGVLFAGLRDAGGPWSTIFTADHGESLGDHSYWWEHGDYVWNSTVQVPLAFVLPEGDPLRRAALHLPWVSLVDVMPTLVDLFDLPMPDDLAYAIEGNSLARAIAGAPVDPHPVFAESGRSHYPEEVRGRVRFDVAGRFRAVMVDNWKLIWTPESPDTEWQLFDLTRDPEEARNLWHPSHARGRELQAELQAWLRGMDQQPVALDEKERELLRSLGYVE